MKKQVLKTTFFTGFPSFRSGLWSLVFALCLSLLISCGKEKEEVSGAIPKEPIQPSVTGVQVSGFIFAGEFQVVNSGHYETLLKTCSRCGTKRLIQTPFGDNYERYWSLGGESLKECGNWLSEGFLQLEFAEKKLPTPVKILFQPKYRGSRDIWGYSFELTGDAKAINKNEGFEIIIPPNRGLGGLYNMILSSTSNNHVTSSDLFISVKYGPLGETIMEPSLTEYTNRGIEKSQFSCREYPPY